MPKNDLRIVTREYLVKQTEYDEGAKEALKQVHEIEAAGGWPKIQYGERSGWVITDERKGLPR